MNKASKVKFVLHSKLSNRLCLLLVSAVPIVAFPSIAGATNSNHTGSSREAINSIPSIQFSSNLSEKLEALSPNEESLVALRPAFKLVDPGPSWVQNQPYVPKMLESLPNEAANAEYLSAVDTFQSLMV
ncbi:hypothetical protein PI95_021615 [Hassallia byssoidea VB512170]|uniref:Uncharacterized protein n=1 Tax=Hassallia byssoidea VB512170 TaxID=1304833 RepID=A0A846HCF6_9CYAN|nr:hypothetical protein [Hassalia byssoidea]NEU75082.1 hypothetical protein [Hassalia byssoidea VB512170]